MTGPEGFALFHGLFKGVHPQCWSVAKLRGEGESSAVD